MRRTGFGTLLLVAAIASPHAALADYDDRPATERGAYTALAVAENILPGVSTIAAPRCLQGYVLCKLSFAAVSLVAAGEHLFFSGGSDLGQTRAILRRGFTGDWVLTGKHAAGDVEAAVFPDPGPSSRAPGSDL